jgi:Ca-activated chloride channel homolog
VIGSITPGSLGFQEPWHLLALVLIPLPFLTVLAARRRRSRYTVSYTNVDTLAGVLRRPSGLRRHAASALFILAMAACITAFAKPTIKTTSTVKSTTIVLLVDVSQSMEAPDVYPYRLAAAVAAMQNFIATLRSTDRVGLVTFSDRVEVLSPPTANHAAIVSELQSLTPEGGTALGPAVDQAVASVTSSLAAIGTHTVLGQYLPGAVILVTDGATNRGSIGTFAAAEAAKRAGVRIYGITVGTRLGTIVEGTGIYRHEIPVPVNSGTIPLLARETGGDALDATTAPQLNAIYKHLGTTVVRTYRRKDIAAWLDLFAAGFLIAGLLLARLRGSVLP